MQIFNQRLSFWHICCRPKDTFWPVADSLWSVKFLWVMFCGLGITGPKLLTVPSVVVPVWITMLNPRRHSYATGAAKNRSLVLPSINTNRLTKISSMKFPGISQMIALTLFIPDMWGESIRWNTLGKLSATFDTLIKIKADFMRVMTGLVCAQCWDLL